MDICAICGRKIVRTGSNWLIKDGMVIHKKCPINKNTLSDEDKKARRELLDKISYYIETKPSDWIAETGLNFQKIAKQIKQLKYDGYTYQEQLWALNRIVDKDGVFYGYTRVVNNIAGVIAKKRENDLKKTTFREQNTSTNEEKSPKTEQAFDLSTMLEESEDW